MEGVIGLKKKKVSVGARMNIKENVNLQLRESEDSKPECFGQSR